MPVTEPIYSTPGGGSNQAKQVNDTVQQLLNGVSLTPAVAQSYNQQFADAGAAQANISNPETRQATLDATGIPGMQQNYADLAQQLAGYDQAVLKPQFEGVNPGQPSDMPTGLFGRGTDLSVLTPESANLPASQGIYNTNPKYAFSAQANQADNILTLLSTLNTAMGKEYQRGKAQYSTKVGDIKGLLDTLGFIIGKNTDLENSRADRALRERELASARGDRVSDKNQANKSAASNRANQLRADLAAGIIGWQDAWPQLKNEFPDLSDEEVDNLLGGRYDPSDPTGTKGLTRGWAKPGAAEEYAQGLRYKQTAANVDTDFTGVANGAKDYLDKFNATGFRERYDPSNSKRIEIENQRKILGQLVAKLIERNRLSNQDRTFYISLLPDPNDPFMLIPGNADAKIKGFMDAIRSNLKTQEEKDAWDISIGESGDSEEGEWK